MVICSFALHLIDNASELFALLWELSTKFRWLVVLAPHKKPEVSEFMKMNKFLKFGADQRWLGLVKMEHGYLECDTTHR